MSSIAKIASLKESDPIESSAVDDEEFVLLKKYLQNHPLVLEEFIMMTLNQQKKILNDCKRYQISIVELFKYANICTSFMRSRICNRGSCKGCQVCYWKKKSRQICARSKNYTTSMARERANAWKYHDQSHHSFELFELVIPIDDTKSLCKDASDLTVFFSQKARSFIFEGTREPIIISQLCKECLREVKAFVAKPSKTHSVALNNIKESRRIDLKKAKWFKYQIRRENFELCKRLLCGIVESNQVCRVEKMNIIVSSLQKKWEMKREEKKYQEQKNRIKINTKQAMRCDRKWIVFNNRLEETKICEKISHVSLHYQFLWGYDDILSFSSSRKKIDCRNPKSVARAHDLMYWKRFLLYRTQEFNEVCKAKARKDTLRQTIEWNLHIKSWRKAMIDIQNRIQKEHKEKIFGLREKEKKRRVSRGVHRAIRCRKEVEKQQREVEVIQREEQSMLEKYNAYGEELIENNRMAHEEAEQIRIDLFWGLPTINRYKRYHELVRTQLENILIQENFAMMVAVGAVALGEGNRIQDIAAILKLPHFMLSDLN